MLEPQLLRHDLDAVAAVLTKRNLRLDITAIEKIEARRKALQIKTEELQALRNSKSKKIGQLKAGGKDAQAVMDEVADIKQQLDESAAALDDIRAKWNEMVIGIPNMPHESVPEGDSEADNQEIRKWGNPARFDFEPKDHVDLGEALSLLDFETATKITGPRFAVMYGAVAQLHRALIQFMLDTHVNEHGYQEINVPYLVNADSCYGTGQLPKFKADLFHIKEQDLYLIPTAEVPMTNTARNALFDADTLPIKYVCHSPCFRSEAGSYGKDTRGMIRQHQFEKVELVQLLRPADSYAALEELTGHAETILQKLNLPYRVVVLCGGDLGFAAAKTYDIEVWLPGQNQYREISSCSNFEAFQARRMQARWRNPAAKKPALLHTLNGSGLAVGRTLIAIMENYQDEAGNIVIPEALRPYMHDRSMITG